MVNIYGQLDATTANVTFVVWLIKDLKTELDERMVFIALSTSTYYQSTSFINSFRPIL